jgi:hypothetical protein
MTSRRSWVGSHTQSGTARHGAVTPVQRVLKDNMKSSTAVSMNTSPGTEAIFKCAVGRDDIYTGRPKADGCKRGTDDGAMHVQCVRNFQARICRRPTLHNTHDDSRSCAVSPPASFTKSIRSTVCGMHHL